MELNADKMKTLIKAIGFLPQNGKTGIYHKVYPSHDGYTIFVDFNQKTFTYDADTNPKNSNITVWEKTTSNFSKAENLVVLECVDRLLEKGYAPSNIELEKVYPSGRGHSGRLDILVKAIDGTPFLMIECKTWGTEYEKEKTRMSKDGGQLFAYYCNARATRYLCLYTSRIETDVEYRNSIIDVEDTWAGLSEVKDIYNQWNKIYKDNGIFDKNASPYDIRHRAITYGELRDLKEEDGGKIYNQILEILRHNAISDKPNAFNKLLNLFVCKIVDEDKNPEDELDFQWRESDTDETFQLRLNDLYKEGMLRFLEIRVIDYSQEDVAQKLAALDPASKQWVMEMYTNIRLKKSPNFAFIEIQDDRTFSLNAKVVREIVELLQVYKFRYAQRQEFLGHLFELLLNTSVKQEAGQYFTPVPIVRFILSALPLQNLVQKRVDKHIYEALPAVIDYACGSGHFLTEYMSQMQSIIDSGKIDLSKASPAIKKQFKAWKSIQFQWARNTVYGIDLDNRLVKTTKVSAFFNGDGEANIIWANGLDHFKNSETYRDKLKEACGQDNRQFDILISNPPYSVDSFKSTIKFGEESFTLYRYLTDNSSEIECLFVERMKQLLKVGGWAAVILPSSILTNRGIHARAREILLKYFNVKAVVELGSGTFMKTGTNTVILFLERRKDEDHEIIIQQIDTFFATKNDVSVAGLDNAFSTFVSSVYDGLSLPDYLSIFSSAPTEAVKAHELYLDYKDTYDEELVDSAIKTEKDKMLYFFLTCDQEIVLVKAGKRKAEKKFLGYEFSERRGREGPHKLPGGTMLYDENDLLSPQKVSSYIYHAFLNDEKPQVVPSLSEYVSYGKLCSFIEYGTSKFDKKVNLGKLIKISSFYPMVSLNALVSIINGVTFDKKEDQVTEETSNAVLTADNITSECTLQIVKKVYLREDFPTNNEKRLLKDDIFICLSSGSKEHVGKCAMIKQNIPFYAGGFMGILRKNSDDVLMKYLWTVLASDQYRAVLPQESTGMNINNLGGTLGNIKIPLPPLDIQQKIVAEIEQYEKKEQRLQADIYNVRAGIATIIEKCRNKAGRVKLHTVASYSKEKIDAKRLNKDTYVGVDNLLPNLGGKRMSEFRPTTRTVTAYHPKNILLSNIRPYLKKAWLADNHGGASGDVLVLVVDEGQALPEYVFALVSTDQFFDYEMQNIGSNVKMPRADKGKVLDYFIPLLPLDEQKEIVATIKQKEKKITELSKQLDAIKANKKACQKKICW